MNDQIMLDDLKVCGLKNDLVTINPKYKKVSVKLVRPTSDLVSDSLDFSPAGVKTMLDAGYNDADKVVQYL
jgi:hypothetical protein